ncbi:hypothetical protein M9R32_04225, partial [Paenisporosarcina quisquiliarum]
IIRKEFKEKSDENIFHHSKDSLSVDIATFIEGGSRTARGKRPHETEIHSVILYRAILNLKRGAILKSHFSMTFEGTPRCFIDNRCCILL